ncbi:Trm112 family protein [Mucilaginibacter pedocola]|uniref:Trm112 family protein n=1 Tax=Mucilaginibacter pedocola TaxID=1792845 RepID=A0A1S9PHG8_9SPHI|nr:Trm112 family protein [Mucilaginibacter pedocola]OOQ60375.1 hypothetical protein BC343_25480 [Mucilaginibacter pedocola]
MKLKTIEKLCCPFDKQELQLQILAQDLEQNVMEGILSCVTCQRKYPIVYGVPIMAPDEYRQLSLEQPVIERWQLEYQIDPLKLLPE